MIFDEFKVLALNPPQREEETIFEVVEYAIDEHLCQTKKKSKYPKFDLRHYTVGFCHTLENAEALIMDAIEDDKKYCTEPYCFYVKEYPVGKFIGHVWEEYAVSMRLYDSKGCMLDRTYCSGMQRDFRTPYGVFRGREKNAIRFKEGDIVEVRDKDEVHLAVIASANMTIERCWELRERWEKKYRGSEKDSAATLVNEFPEEDYPVDSSDDQSPVIDGPGYDTHEHIHTLNIMPLRYPLSDRLRKRYGGYYEAMLEKEEKYRQEEERKEAEQLKRFEEVKSRCLKYADIKIDISPEEALKLLAECYVDLCGISLGVRTVVYDCGEFWMEQLAKSQQPLSVKASEGSFMNLMPDLLGQDIFEKAQPDKYDVAPLDSEEAMIVINNVLTEVTDERLRKVLSLGFLYVIDQY
ncbi:hypothetical protein [uncultured Duncaniella sp.]|uniref:hypothetical protein n=1 Tax=uncultured Duncaniella sp. TaxID=2768039 RepID=UPI002606E9E3|nr:hypothetical protein [uncultured Duncaniella sp.]